MVGGRIDDGFKTSVTFALNPLLKIWIKTVKPPGLTGGGSVNTTTMRNTRFRTKSPKKLYEMTDGEIKGAYDPAVLLEMFSMLQVIQLITIKFADNSTQVFYGWLEEFEPDEISEGVQPEAKMKFVCSGEDSNNVETPPTYGSGS